MKRSPLKRRSPIRRKKPRRLTGPKADRDYLERVRQLECSAANLGDCWGANHAHHPRHRAGGVGLKAPDDSAISVCNLHHLELHGLAGAFKGWSRQELVDWQDRYTARTRRLLGVDE